MKDNEYPNIFKNNEIKESISSETTGLNKLGNTIYNTIILNNKNLSTQKDIAIFNNNEQNNQKNFFNHNQNHIYKNINSIKKQKNEISDNKKYSAKDTSKYNLKQINETNSDNIQTLKCKIKKIYDVDMNINTQYDIKEEDIINIDEKYNNKNNNKITEPNVIDKISETSKSKNIQSSFKDSCSIQNEKIEKSNNNSNSIQDKNSQESFQPIINNTDQKIIVNNPETNIKSSQASSLNKDKESQKDVNNDKKSENEIIDNYRNLSLKEGLKFLDQLTGNEIYESQILENKDDELNKINDSQNTFKGSSIKTINSIIIPAEYH